MICGNTTFRGRDEMFLPFSLFTTESAHIVVSKDIRYINTSNLLLNVAPLRVLKEQHCYSFSRRMLGNLRLDLLKPFPKVQRQLWKT